MPKRLRGGGRGGALRRVRVGHRGPAEVQVLEGVEAGETVVLFPSDRIAEGVRVVPREEA